MERKSKPKYFKNQLAFRKWLEENHLEADELWVGYYKKATGKASITWKESVDEALCFGWIDGIRKSIDEYSYTNRFTPRRTRSHWSYININRIEELIKEGLVKQAGLAAYEKRKKSQSGRASYEQNTIKLDKNYESKIKLNKKAWAYYDALAPSYKKNSIWWVMSAKKEETRIRRLNILIESAENGLKIPLLRK